jgi:hypothetical protein
MRIFKFFVPVLTILLFTLFLFANCTGTIKNENEPEGNLSIGWSSVDITPDSPILIWGQRNARVSEGVLDPVTATVLAIESGEGISSKKAILISCDLVAILDGVREPDMYFTPGTENNLLNNVRKIVKETVPDINPEQIIMNGTHTHTGPFYGSDESSERIYGIELDIMSPSDVQHFISEKIASAIKKAWDNRKPGGISYGLGHAVVGRNRLLVSRSGKGIMYGNTNSPEFSHIEGYEDHSVNLLYTWDKSANLTGVVVNLACPAQVTEGLYKISADFWHETRVELRNRLGKNIFVLPQCSAAGDQSPHIMTGLKAETRMQQIMFPDCEETGDRGMGLRKQIAVRIADAVTSVLPYMKDNIEWDPVIAHNSEKVHLTRRQIPLEDVERAIKESESHIKKYEQLLADIKKDPSIKNKPRWYVDVSLAFSQTYRGYSVKERYELQKVQPKLPVEIHVVRIGDVVFATNPFELYLDFGSRIKARSPAVQTFLVQLTGSGTYVPPYRSVAGGSYGAEPASTLVGPEGGQELVEKTVEMIDKIMN